MTGAASPSRLAQRFAPQHVGVPEDPDVRVVFTGREAPHGATSSNLSWVVGDGDVAGARAAALALIGGTPERSVFMSQVHGGDVAVVDAADAGRGVADHADAIPGVDALVTSATDLALAVLVADCVPVVLVDPGRAVGVAHAGRGGVIGGVVPAAVARLAPQNAGDVIALIGPAVGGCCYEVPDDMAAQVAARVPAARATTTWGTASLDLRAAVTQQLEAAGVRRVEVVGACTRCNADRWFSHRAASVGAAPHGRQAGLVLRASRAGEPAGDGDMPSLESRRAR